MSDDFQSHERLTATKLNRALRAGRCIARGRRITNSSASASTSRVGVLRIDDIPMTGGRLYRIATSRLAVDTTVNADTAQVELLYTTDGSTPSLVSTTLPGGNDEVDMPSAARAEYLFINTHYVPATDETFSVIMTIRRTSGTGSVVLQADGTSKVIDLTIFDCGEDPGDVGVDL